MNPPDNIAGYNPNLDSEGYYFDEFEAERRIKFFERCLTHASGHLRGQPFLLEQWQKNLIATIFGWKKDVDDLRRYTTVFLEVPRKNGKSIMAAGVALCCLHLDGEGGAQVFCAAGDREQASLVFSVAADQTRACVPLDSVSKVLKAQKRIVVASTGSVLRAVPANEGANHGSSPHCWVGDEVHVWPNRILYDEFHTGMGSRFQPLEVLITTAGYDEETFCYELHDTALKVRDRQIVDATFLPAVYAASKDDDWTSEETWKKANPNYGISVRKEFLEKECIRAKNSPAHENTFKRLYLNIWTEQSTRWLSMEDWKNCECTDEDIVGPTVGGLDLSNTTDLTAWCIFEPHTSRMRWRYYIPEDQAKKLEHNDRVPYSLWAREGWVTLTPGNSIDYRWVEEDILEDMEKYKVEAIGVDPWNAKQTIKRFREDMGFEMLEIRQGFATMTAPTKEFERLVITHQLDHGRNPITKWCASNVEIEADRNGNIMPTKSKRLHRRKKIDGIVSGIIAIATWFACPQQVEGGFMVL